MEKSYFVVYKHLFCKKICLKYTKILPILFIINNLSGVKKIFQKYLHLPNIIDYLCERILTYLLLFIV
jgi:hypothetical protein